MSIRRESIDETYDVIVVGSGMGGLSAAALLAKGGKKVLVVERHNVAGGYAHGFKRGKYFFDSAAHATSTCEPVPFGDPAIIDWLLRALGVRERCTFLPLDPFYRTCFPGFRMDAPAGIDAFIEAHAEHFPQERQALRQILRLFTRINREFKKLPSDISSYDAVRMPEKFPILNQYKDATLAQVMDEYLTDPRLKAVFSTLWGYQGLPPSRMGVISWSTMLMSFIHTGAFYVQGGMQNLASAVAEGLENHGGELLLRSEVRRIMVEDGHAAGVVLENRQRIRAPVVISNVDALQTFEELVGVEHLPTAFVQNLRQLKPSLSAVLVYMATKMDLAAAGAEHELFFFQTWDHDETYEKLLRGEPTGVLVTIPTLVDSTVAPPGEHLVTATILCPYQIVDSWRQEKERYIEMVLDQVEREIPGYRDQLVFMEGASPRTMERYTLNTSGAIYGWERSPEQTGANRLGRVTPIEGLYLSGHWTQPGGGIAPVTVSGVMTAQLLLGYAEVDDLLRAFGL